ncbi:MAG: hypothetical protein AAGE52_36020 [Myxococcota bacterium]
MATKKPRKIKDLKARLGKTIAPNTPQDGDGVAPPPSVTGAEPKPKPAVAPPGGVVAPPAAVKPAAAPGIVAPPFAQKKEAPKPAAPADPFAAQAPAAGPQEVRLVFDDKPVDDGEVGRKRKGRTMMLLALGGVLGLLLGYFSGNVMDQRKIHNMAVRDGKEIYDAVREASNVVSEAQRLVDEAVRKARGGAGQAPSVDYESIEALRALEKPFQANIFSRKNYSLFRTETVDSMFDYYNHINQMWGRIEAISAMTSGDARREELNSSAASMENATALVGCLIRVDEERYQCNLGFVTVPEDSQGQVQIRPSQRSRASTEKTLYVGEGDLSTGEFVILINNQQSMGVLGAQSTLFAEFVREIGAIKALVDETVEIQGRVETGLGEVASNEELFAF